MPKKEVCGISSDITTKVNRVLLGHGKGSTFSYYSFQSKAQNKNKGPTAHVFNRHPNIDNGEIHNSQLRLKLDQNKKGGNPSYISNPNTYMGILVTSSTYPNGLWDQYKTNNLFLLWEGSHITKFNFLGWLELKFKDQVSTTKLDENYVYIKSKNTVMKNILLT